MVIVVVVCVSFAAGEGVNSCERKICLGRCAWYMFFVDGHLLYERCDAHACLQVSSLPEACWMYDMYY